MRATRFLLLAIVAGCLWLEAGLEAKAAEYGFSTYVLGQNAFSAGVTPPPGTYVTSATFLYAANIGRTVEFGGVTLGAGATVDLNMSAINGLYVFDHKVFGGNLGVSATVPVGFIDIDAMVTAGGLSAQRSTEGGGLGDIVSKVQLGWQHGEFSHTMYVQAVAPTGRYETGFNPIIGLHRPGIDTGWAFTWVNKATSLQWNGALGVTFNFENTATNYKTGDEFHFEWAIGRELSLAPELLERHPFPGPGLAVRILGEVTRERCDALRAADAIIEEEIRAAGLYEAIWQSFGVLLPVRTVGVMGDERTYDEVIALRAVESQDGMTADWARLSHDTLETIARRITNEVRGVNRVVYDISSKPPATIEWE
jgi:hypothetical protein